MAFIGKLDEGGSAEVWRGEERSGESGCGGLRWNEGVLAVRGGGIGGWVLGGGVGRMVHLLSW